MFTVNIDRILGHAAASLLQYTGRYHNYAAAGDVPLGGASVRSGICLHAVVTQQLILVDLTDDRLGGGDDVTQLRLTSLKRKHTRHII